MNHTQRPAGEPRFHSVPATARILGISPATLYRAIAAGEFPAVRIRNRLIIPAEIIDQLRQTSLEQRRVVDAADWVVPVPLPRSGVA